MNSQFYFEKLEDSEEYKNFMKANPSAYLCSGFFVIESESELNKCHIDFYIPEAEKTFSFELGEKVVLSEIDRKENVFSNKVCIGEHIDFREIRDLIEKRMEEEKIKNKIQKMLFSLQSKAGKNYLLGTIFISGFGLIKTDVNLSEKKLLGFEKSSLFDIVKFVKTKEKNSEIKDQK